MTHAGIGPELSYPPGCCGPPGMASDAEADFEGMLAPLVQLEELHLIEVERSLAGVPQLVHIVLELEADGPHLDLVAQLLGLIERVLHTRGVVLKRRQIERIARLAAHADLIRAAYDAMKRLR